jgi:alpha-L-fucosidase
MQHMKKFILLSTHFLLVSFLMAQKNFLQENKADKNKRMKWWREARFGMFIHWGLYAVPAGEWKGATNHAEWIRTTAQIPLDEYNQFVPRFNPVSFNAEAWVRMAKDAGMKYITITSKHHDGFCLWDSKQTDFDIKSTPFKRDILKELADACRKIGGIRLCFYHSIMDWHHPDYNERREWEKDRPVDGTERKTYITYMKNQLKELVSDYGDIGVIWFDGEWEGFWTHEDGKDLYNYVRSLKPGIIINNRVDKGRAGMAGMTTEGDYGGDFGTPEQEIPETGLPGVDWESCMTMNNNWGFNKADKNFKSTEDLIQKLVDIASKGGNFLLNIGPKADGTFPQESIDRLKAIGNWMKVNGESIYGTAASPFEHTAWGKVTQKQAGSITKLYLHVFNWQSNNGTIKLNGIENRPIKAYRLADKKAIPVSSQNNTITVQLAGKAPDSVNTVIVVEIPGKAIVYKAPVITAWSTIFTDSREVDITVPGEKGKMIIRYTLNGSDPVSTSPLYDSKITLSQSAVLKARCFVGNKVVSEITEMKFEKVMPAAGMNILKATPGLQVNYYEGDWDKMPLFSSLDVKETLVTSVVSNTAKKGKERYGLVLQGFITIPQAEVYIFYLSSDDGSKLFLDDQLLIDNDGLHGMVEKKGTAALAQGYHSIRIEYFDKTGGDDLKLVIESMKMKKQEITASMLVY